MNKKFWSQFKNNFYLYSPVSGVKPCFSPVVIGALLVCLVVPACSGLKQGDTIKLSMGKKTGLEVLSQEAKDKFTYLAIDADESESFSKVTKAITSKLYLDALQNVYRDTLNNRLATDKLEASTAIQSQTISTNAASEAAQLEAAQ